MSEHVLSILVKALGASKAAKDLKGVDSALSNIGRRAGAGLATAAGNLAKLSLVAGGALGAAVHSGIEDLATLEDATTKVSGAIKQMGQTGQVTAAQVATWANDIEANIGAAFDDKAITSATATLIRFGSVTPKNLHAAMVVMTDLAAKTGDVDSAATLLAKALADPTKAAGKLSKQGIVLTKVQQDNIKALVKAGKVEQAQAMILDLIAVKTKGAAAATQGPYRRSLSVLADVTEDAKKALAEGFLPVLERVSAFLSKKLADPKTIDDIRGLGRGLADAFDKVLGAADKIPWGTIGDSMRLAGQGAKAALDLFTQLPPWVQTAVITGWGLNKLTGGALTGIFGELGKGLIKGVLGMNAGVVNLKAGVVNGGVGGIGAAGGAGGATSKLGKIGSAIGKVFLVGAAAGAFFELKGILDEQSARNKQQETGLTAKTNDYIKVAGIDDLKASLAGIDQYVADSYHNDIAFNAAWNLNIDGVRDAVNAQRTTLQNAISSLESQAATASVRSTDRLEAIRAGEASVRDKIESARIATLTGAQTIRTATTAAGAAAAAGGKQGGLISAAATRAKDMSVTVRTVVNTAISVRSVLGANTAFKQYSKVGVNQF